MATMNEAIKILLEEGYIPNGETPREVVRIITQKSYPLPGAEVLTGGRLRFENPPFRATVGKRTVCLYEMVNGKPANHKNIDTKNFCRDDLERSNMALAGDDLV